jgi:hypothetical protein
LNARTNFSLLAAPRLDLENYPHLPVAEVQTTQAADYMALLSAQPASLAEISMGEVTR